MQTVPVSVPLDQTNAAYVIQSVVAEANKIDASMMSAQIQNSVILLYSMGGFLAVQPNTVLEQRLRIAQNMFPAQLPVSMRLNTAAAAFAVQGVLSEANKINGSLFATQIGNAVDLLYSIGGLIAVQAGSVLDQRLLAAAQGANAAQQAPAPAAQPIPPRMPQPPAQARIPVPPPVIPPAYPVVPPAPEAAPGNPEITIAGQPVVDVQVTPLG